MTKWMQALAGCLLAGCGGWASAQSDFQGAISMTITGHEAKPVPFVYKVKGKMVRVELQMGARAVTIIMDTEAHKQTILMPEMQAYMVHEFDMAQIYRKEGISTPPTVTDLHTTDTVAGHICENYQVTAAKFSAAMCSAKDLPGGFFGNGPSAPSLDGLGTMKDYGMPLKIVTQPIKDGPGPMTLEVTKIEPGPVDNSVFEVPTGWHEMQGMGGMGAPGSTPPPQ